MDAFVTFFESTAGKLFTTVSLGGLLSFCWAQREVIKTWAQSMANWFASKKIRELEKEIQDLRGSAPICPACRRVMKFIGEQDAFINRRTPGSAQLKKERDPIRHYLQFRCCNDECSYRKVQHIIHQFMTQPKI